MNEASSDAMMKMTAFATRANKRLVYTSTALIASVTKAPSPLRLPDSEARRPIG
jgi:hypothetical protein